MERQDLLSRGDVQILPMYHSKVQVMQWTTGGGVRGGGVEGISEDVNIIIADALGALF